MAAQASLTRTEATHGAPSNRAPVRREGGRGALRDLRADGGGIAPLWGVAAVVFFPVLYGVGGFIATLITAWLYNVVAGAVGGLELDLS